MCGITGFWQYSSNQNRDWMKSIMAKMCAKLTHRGPDSQGIWLDDKVGIALGHRRLAIVDLSPQGHQPMLSADERYVIIFNGEIYNFSRLRNELQDLGYSFRGHSDTEVMLVAFSHWGVEDALSRFIGMFAFALWDRFARVLYLGRDRLGEKPLYYGFAGDTFVFASELKALTVYPQWRGKIERNVLALFLRYNYIPAPYSIYQGIYKLPPGNFLKLPIFSIESQQLPQPKTYWSLKNVIKNHKFSSEKNTDYTQLLEELLKNVIQEQMVADVPLGAFLSGGIDSSTVVTLMQSQSSRPIQTFTIGFYEDEYNEAHYAQAISQHLGTEHTELYINPETAIDIVPKLPIIYDEPFADSSQIPTFLVAQLARQKVTVSLSGDGGDELFGGYSQYFWGQGIWQSIGWIPLNLRRIIANFISGRSPDEWNNIFSKLPVSPFNYFSAGESLSRLAFVLGEKQGEGIYKYLMSQWLEPDSVVLGSQEPLTHLSNQQEWLDGIELFRQMMYLDTLTELPDDILVKVDRATMSVSLESRCPFLDHRVVELAWKMPLSIHIHQGKGKMLLRKILSRYLPENLIERPKKGFSVPLNQWLRSGKLRDWAESLLDEKRLESEGFFNSKIIRHKWEQHLSGEYNWQSHLWNVLMFQGWLEQLDTLSLS